MHKYNENNVKSYKSVDKLKTMKQMLQMKTSVVRSLKTL